MRVVDLSVALAPDLPCWWPELEPFSAEQTFTLALQGVSSRNLRIEEHCGTHMDAPCHIADEHGAPTRAMALDEIPLNDLAGRARVIDVRDLPVPGPGLSTWIDVDRLEAYEARQGPVAEGDVVLLWSGWTDRYYRPFPEGSAYVEDPLAGRAPGWPAPTGDFIEALADRGVKALGVDTPTLGAIQDNFTPHRAALRRGVTPIEGLTALGSIEGREATFLFLPLPVIGATGAPGRAVAMLKES